MYYSLFVLAQRAPSSLSKRKVLQVPNEKQFKGNVRETYQSKTVKKPTKKKHKHKLLLRNFAQEQALRFCAFGDKTDWDILTNLTENVKTHSLFFVSVKKAG